MHIRALLADKSSPIVDTERAVMVKHSANPMSFTDAQKLLHACANRILQVGTDDYQFPPFLPVTVIYLLFVVFSSLYVVFRLLLLRISIDSTRSIQFLTTILGVLRKKLTNLV
jgi:hypothetical protein